MGEICETIRIIVRQVFIYRGLWLFLLSSIAFASIASIIMVLLQLQISVERLFQYLAKTRSMERNLIFVCSTAKFKFKFN